MSTKRCQHCRERKPREDFPPNKRTRDGLSSWCRACHREATRRYRARKKALDAKRSAR